ncbi:MAG: hypothetical protein ABI995_04715 [Acidobacteriota bacterium]
MTYRILSAMLAAGACATLLMAQQKHPDFSGTWQYSVALPGGGVKQVVQGKVVLGAPDASGRNPAKGGVAGALPSTPAPSFKADMLAKVKETEANQSKTDGTFYCGKPGVPRIGPPRKIVQTAGELLFFYEDMSGDQYRIVPFTAKHREDVDPSFNGDSIARWDGETLVVESVNFVPDTWFGENGYVHSDAMKVTERFWKQGENMAYQVTVDDPKALTAPWVMAARVIKPSDEPLIESAACVEDDAHRLTNKDHHLQR